MITFIIVLNMKIKSKLSYLIKTNISTVVCLFGALINVPFIFTIGFPNNLISIAAVIFCSYCAYRCARFNW